MLLGTLLFFSAKFSALMDLSTTLQGRFFGADQFAAIRCLLESNQGGSRYQLSRQLAEQWQWCTPTGQLKDMAARTLLETGKNRGLANWI